MSQESLPLALRGVAPSFRLANFVLSLHIYERALGEISQVVFLVFVVAIASDVVPGGPEIWDMGQCLFSNPRNAFSYFRRDLWSLCTLHNL